MTTTRRLFLIVCALALGAASVARAHTVWLESQDKKLVVRFAEPGNDFEKSPGYLDSLAAPAAFVLVTNAPSAVEISKKSDHFLLVGKSPANTACVETSFTVRGGRKPFFYARWQPAHGGASKPLLTLDLVPTGKKGEARAYFRGQPLPGVKATLRAPDGKEDELTADAEGLIHFTATQSGLYLLTISHYRDREPLAGFDRGVAYKEASHNCALTWQN